MTKRSKVELFEKIRRARRVEPDVSLRELSRRFETHRRTVREAVASAVPAPRKRVERASPVLDEWKPIIDGWLAADRDAPRKQRHTARRVWQRLVDEHDAQVGESTVRRYVAEAKRSLPPVVARVIVPQSHPLGAEAEIDFGQVSFALDGLVTEGWMFVFRLSASGKAFHRVYLNQAQQAFFDGHVRAFDHIGGVPGRVRYDNLKPAVIRVLQGRDRLESDQFIALRSHYGFDSFFCTPGIDGAHEKGGVEGEVGRFRRRHLVPVPRVASMTELNVLLAAGCASDDRRHIARRTITVAEHFALEADTLMALRGEAFDVTAIASHRVDRKSRVAVRGTMYSVPARLVGRRVDVRVGAETVEVYDGPMVVARHARARKGDEVLALDHYLEVLAIKTGAFAGASALGRARAGGVFGPAHEQLWSEARRRLGDRDGTRALIEVLLLHRSIDNDALIAGIGRAMTAGSIDPALIAIEARRCAEPTIAVVVPIGEGLNRFDRPAPTIAHYDDLLEAQ